MNQRLAGLRGWRRHKTAGGIWLLTISFLAVFLLNTASADSTVLLIADRDNTLYETVMGAGEAQNEFGNGAGSFLFAGRTRLDAGFRLRRGVLRFDLTDLPTDAEILSAELTLYQSSVSPGAFPVMVSLHRLLEEWGEGASDGVGPEGQGALAQPGDATWLHRFYNTATWTEEGGSFEAIATASTTVGLTLGDYSWTCSSSMVADLQAWLDNSAVNFGWIVIGGEAGGGTARRFNSRENLEVETRPRLRVVYRSPDEVYADGFETPQACE